MAALTWSEEFDGPRGAPPDPDTCTAELGGGGWGSHQLQQYTAPPANAALDGRGALVITARREAGQVTSARLRARNRVHLRFGRIEARIKVPAGQGMWPAFWMLGADYADDLSWPACGEIDIMEQVGSEPSVVHGTLHGPGFAGLAEGIGRAHHTGVVLAEAFHVYRVDWSAERVTWHLDGEPYFTLTPTDIPGQAWPFRHNFFLLINLAVNGDWPGNSNDNPALPAELSIDWIRAYDSSVTVAGSSRRAFGRPEGGEGIGDP